MERFQLTSYPHRTKDTSRADGDGEMDEARGAKGQESSAKSPIN